ncbi:anillin isoform X2 [Brachyhypopomus gauderio]|uniref:anillin isoform X2 n=1 Tax=Brachyhypopomus gauderio TaxID=698409 RepID=UPI00404136B9
MDPFTEKLLERTRARRENLQKKLAERPTAANRQMVKRTREPLAETNSIISVPPTEKVLPSPLPSASKRRCSEENAPLTGEENKEPVAITDKKPPMAPSSIHSASVERMTVCPSSDTNAGLVCPASDTGKIVLASSQTIPGSTENVMKCSVLEEEKDIPKDGPAHMPTSSNMRSRLQRLAEQRQYWDSEGNCEPVSSSMALSPLKSQRLEVTTAPPPALAPSDKPVGRKGRLANLAATISSWEDDLGHAPACQDAVKGKPAIAYVAPPAYVEKSISTKTPAVTQPTLHVKPVASKPVHSTPQMPVYSPVKSSRVIPPAPQKTEVPGAKLSKGLSSPVSSPGKSCPSQPSTPIKSEKVPSHNLETSSGSHSPLKVHTPSKESGAGTVFTPSPTKSKLPTKPSSSLAVSQGDKRLATEATPKQRGPAGTPGVKSFLERFGERCQERSQGSPLGGGGQGRTPAATPLATPKSRLLQERLPVAQSSSTTAILTQKHKMEREAELAQIRNRFQNDNKKSKEDLSEVKGGFESKTVEDLKEGSDTALCSEPSAPLLDNMETPSKISECEMSSAKPDTASPVKCAKLSVEKAKMDEQGKVEKTKEDVHELEMNVDGSVNSEVINDLFDGVLEESGQSSADENEEEDALNISSMSLLTPLAETVAAVVKSPERKIMTSTPTSSFNVRSGTPESVSRPTKFQRAWMQKVASSDGSETLDEEHKLPYSIDAYRSTRVKDSERPQVKQVIVRKEDVSKRVENRDLGHISIRQKMQVLTNEMNLQQSVIHQASQALNCCTDEEHGKGSQVEAEAERLLLIATEKRVALKAELDRLKAEGPVVQKKNPSRTQDDMGVPASKGSITLEELRLPLKADFVCSTANKPESRKHYFFVMIRAGPENTVATPLANTQSALSGDALTFSTKFTLPDVSSDFEIDIEVYYLVQKSELLLDKRKKPSKSKAITPKRFLAITKSNLQTPVMASPGGPNAVRTSNFALVGSHKLTLASIGKNKFPLEKVPFLSPLEGHVYLRMHCEVDSRVEERGFLTMFEDVSGFGAWHRRWCVLSGYCISYWTYPDDEKRKNPIGRLNLANCVSRKIEPANREFCARPNTFELITVRPQREDDKETLVSQCKNTMCVTKNWLSADTKEERNLWMHKLNQILVDLRMWQPDACYSPV